MQKILIDWEIESGWVDSDWPNLFLLFLLLWFYYILTVISLSSLSSLTMN